MDPYEEYLTDLIAQKRKEGLIPDLDPNMEPSLADRVTEALQIFKDAPPEETIAALQQLRELLLRLNEASEPEGRQ